MQAASLKTAIHKILFKGFRYIAWVQGDPGKKEGEDLQYMNKHQQEKDTN